MNLRNLEYLVQEAFIGIWRNGIMAVASVSTVALSLAILGAFVLLAVGSHRLAEGELKRFQIAVFLPVEANQQDAERVRDSIRALPLTQNVDLRSKDQEWAEFRRRRNIDINLGGVIGNPLPYALFVQSKDPHKTNILAEEIRRIKGIDEVNNSEENFKHVRALTDLVKLLGLVAVIVLFFTTTFVISNAIRLTVFARRHEIKIMQLVGATNWFIRLPLVLEGMVFGAGGAVVAAGLVSVGAKYVASVVQQVFPAMLLNVSSGIDPSRFIISLVAGGAVIGALGSMVSIRRFLRT